MKDNDTDRDHLRNRIVSDSSSPQLAGAKPASASSHESLARFEVVKQEIQQVKDSVKSDNLIVWTKQFCTGLGAVGFLYLITIDAVFQWHGRHYNTPEMAWVVSVALVSGSAFDLLAQYIQRLRGK